MTPAADVLIDEPLIRALLREQAPGWVDVPLARAASGWDNEMWRLGDDLVVRLPRRAAASALMANEHRWLTEVSRLIPTAVPVPVVAGRPGSGYPYPWSIAPWLHGVAAGELVPVARDDYAGDLAAALASLHRPAPVDAPRNPFRGTPLAPRRAAVSERIENRTWLATIWRDALAAPAWAGTPRWIHGDPHPMNVLASTGRLAGLLDFGDLGCGDPASDLGAIWLHFTAAGRHRFVADYDAASELGALDRAALWRRARGWAVSYATLFEGLEPGSALHRCGCHALDELATTSTAGRMGDDVVGREPDGQA